MRFGAAEIQAEAAALGFRADALEKVFRLIALLESLHSDDPTALVGLPLIRTCALLRQAGIDPLRPR